MPLYTYSYQEFWSIRKYCYVLLFIWVGSLRKQQVMTFRATICRGIYIHDNIILRSLPGISLISVSRYVPRLSETNWSCLVKVSSHLAPASYSENLAALVLDMASSVLPFATLTPRSSSNRNLQEDIKKTCKHHKSFTKFKLNTIFSYDLVFSLCRHAQDYKINTALFSKRVIV